MQHKATKTIVARRYDVVFDLNISWINELCQSQQLFSMLIYRNSHLIVDECGMIVLLWTTIRCRCRRNAYLFGVVYSVWSKEENFNERQHRATIVITTINHLLTSLCCCCSCCNRSCSSRSRCNSSRCKRSRCNRSWWSHSAFCSCSIRISSSWICSNSSCSFGWCSSCARSRRRCSRLAFNSSLTKIF